LGNIVLSFRSSLYVTMHHFRSRGSSVSIVSDYGLEDRATGIRSPAGAKDFSSNLCIQTDSGANPASCTMGTEGPFPKGKARPGRDADHSPPFIAVAPLPSSASVACCGTALVFKHHFNRVYHASVLLACPITSLFSSPSFF
jgi:hypothetical protein